MTTNHKFTLVGVSQRVLRTCEQKKVQKIFEHDVRRRKVENVASRHELRNDDNGELSRTATHRHRDGRERCELTKTRHFPSTSLLAEISGRALQTRNGGTSRTRHFDCNLKELKLHKKPISRVKRSSPSGQTTSWSKMAIPYVVLGGSY